MPKNAQTTTQLHSSHTLVMSFPDGSDGKASACNMGDPSLIPGLGRSPGEGNGHPLQYVVYVDQLLGQKQNGERRGEPIGQREELQLT